MPAISPADAISPAIQRTKIFLFRPFSLGTYLKLCLVAALTEGSSGGGNFNFSNWGNHSHSRQSFAWPNMPVHVTPLTIAAGLAMIALVMLLGFWIAWLITRLRFAYFHCLIHNIKFIRPGWRLYREPATRFFWLNVVVGLCFLVCLLLALLPFAAGFIGLYHTLQSGGRPNVGAIFALILPMIPIILLFALAGIAVNIVLRDFMLPHYALENATAGQAWSAVWARIRFEKGGFFVYALLRVLLPIVASIGIVVVLIIPAILCIIVGAVVVVALHAALGSGPAGIFIAVSVGIVAFVVAMAVFIAVFGPVYTWTRQYALLFYGNRYQPLGDILYPPPPPIAIPAPVMP